MPTRPKTHRPEGYVPYDKARGTRTQRGYDNRWLRYSKQFLNEHPLCAECERQGRVTSATCVDHIVPHKGDKVLFDDPANHQPLCQKCHGIKSGKGL